MNYPSLEDKNEFEVNSIFVEACQKGQLDTIKFIQENRKDVELKIETGFLYSCLHNHLTLMKYFYNFEPNINNVDTNDRAFTLAYKHRYEDIIHYLIFDLSHPKTKNVELQMKMLANNKVVRWFEQRDLNQKLNEELPCGKIIKEQKKPKL